METPFVSICSITYNHAPFIRQCLDCFLMQQTNFPIEIIINDDCSTDGTTEIIREYAEKYPDKIFPIFHEENLYSQGVRGMFQRFVFPNARGKYIALCEGDDHWTDPHKLQKQVDFLEAHPDYSMCCHAAIIKSHNSELIHSHCGSEDCDLETKDIFLRGGEYIMTASICFRSSLLRGLAEFSQGCPVGDYPLQIWCAMHGKIRWLTDSMSVYRLSSNTESWSSRIQDKKIYLKTYTDHLNWLERIFQDIPFEYRGMVKQLIAQHRENGCLVMRDIRLIGFRPLSFVRIVKRILLLILRGGMSKIL